MASDNSDLDFFVDFLFDGLQGYAYLVMKDPADKDSWNSQMFLYPEQQDSLKHFIKVGFEKYEVYLAPVLYSIDDNAQRPNVKCSNVVWTEFDGNTPDDWEGYPPSLVIRSSSEGHEHVYWRLDNPLFGADAIEDITRRITFNYGADSSAWDATQVLRPPGTINHKRGLPTFVLSSITDQYNVSVFETLAPAPVAETVEWQIGELPAVHDVVLRYAFTHQMAKLFSTELVEEGRRSSALMEFAFSACELGMKDVEVFVLLKVLDDRWGKFVGRRDRDKRLASIITHARNKYPGTVDEDEAPSAFVLPYRSFMAVEVNVDWVVNDFLMDNGNLLLAGPSGVGKTQFLLQLMIHLALGKNFLHYEIPKAQRVLFLSLEMTHPELKVFLNMQDSVLSDEERDLLEQNFHIIPHGEAWGLNQPHGQDFFHQFIEQVEPNGVFVDSIGSSILGNINSQENVQPFLNYVDKTRKKFGVFWGAIHHTRKAAPGQRGTSQDDVYGDQYFVNRASSVYGILHGRDKTIKIDNWKQRLAAKEAPYYVRRDSETVTFSKATDIADGSVPSAFAEGEVPDEDVTKANGFDL